MSFIHAPFRADRGRRTLSTAEVDAYGKWDFLKDNRPEEQKKTPVVGQSDGRASKFSTGFYRRSAASIWAAQGEEASIQAAQRTQRLEQSAVARRERLKEVETRNGNILAPTPATEKLFDTRRHFPSHDSSIAAQNAHRQRSGASRFHAPPSPAEEATRQAKIAAAASAQSSQRASLIGYGRSDVATAGAVDNFKAPTPAVVMARPKLRPPPADSLAARLMRGTLRLEDGSQGSSNSVPGSRLHSSAGPTVSAATRERRSRANQTSMDMRAAFSFGGGGGAEGEGAGRGEKPRIDALTMVAAGRRPAQSDGGAAAALSHQPPPAAAAAP